MLKNKGSLQSIRGEGGGQEILNNMGSSENTAATVRDTVEEDNQVNNETNGALHTFRVQQFLHTELILCSVQCLLQVVQ